MRMVEGIIGKDSQQERGRMIEGNGSECYHIYSINI